MKQDELRGWAIVEAGGQIVDTERKGFVNDAELGEALDLGRIIGVKVLSRFLTYKNSSLKGKWDNQPREERISEVKVDVFPLEHDH